MNKTYKIAYCLILCQILALSLRLHVQTTSTTYPQNPTELTNLTSE